MIKKMSDHSRQRISLGHISKLLSDAMPCNSTRFSDSHFFSPPIQDSVLGKKSLITQLNLQRLQPNGLDQWQPRTSRNLQTSDNQRKRRKILLTDTDVDLTLGKQTVSLGSKIHLPNYADPKLLSSDSSISEPMKIEDYEEIEAAQNFSQRARLRHIAGNDDHSQQTFVQNQMNAISSNILEKSHKIKLKKEKN